MIFENKLMCLEIRFDRNDWRENKCVRCLREELGRIC